MDIEPEVTPVDPPAFVNALRGLAAQIEAAPEHGALVLTSGEPATDAQIAQVEEALGASIPDHLKAFYKVANGVRLRWGPDFEGDDGEPYDEYAMAAINMQPVEKALEHPDGLYWFSDEGTDDPCPVEGLDIESEQAFRKQIRVFDENRGDSPMFYLLGDDEPRLFLGEDSGAGFEVAVSFEAYLGRLIYCYGCLVFLEEEEPEPGFSLADIVEFMANA